MSEVRSRTQPVETLGLREVWVFVIMAGASGAAVMAHAFFPVQMRYSVPFLVLPMGVVLLMTLRHRASDLAGVRLISGRVMAGAQWGLIATVVYDIVRPPLGLLFSDAFLPYRAMPVFGDLITGRGTDDLLAQSVGWVYHFWNGVGFGIMFALVAPRAGRWWGVGWGLFLQFLMMATYPSLLGARLDDVGFLVTGIVGHGLWGYTLGRGLESRRGAHG